MKIDEHDHPYVRMAPTLTLGPGLGRHPSRALFRPSEETAPTPAHRSVAEALRHRAHTQPEVEGFFFFDARGRLSSLTNGAMFEWASRVAATLSSRGVAPRERVLLSFDTEPNLLAAFFGCALLGAVPLLAEPPRNRSRPDAWLARLERMVAHAEVRAMIVAEPLRALVGVVQTEPSPVPVLGPADLLDAETSVEVPAFDPEALAFIQFSSGTTSDTKGVMVSNRCVVANIQAMGDKVAYRKDEMTVGWLPLCHDMGLIGTVLWPLFNGSPMALMSPMSFVLRPQNWLWALHYFNGTISPAPNFAYQMCTKRIADAELEGLDLSSWRLAINGAEFIHHRTVQMFCRRFQPAGFRSTAHYPVYGMAETVVAAAFPSVGSEPRTDFVCRERLSADGELAPVPFDEPTATPFVSVGMPFPGHEVRIISEEGHVQPERRQGQILLRGPSVCAGYANLPEVSARVFRDGWLHTGDLGYLADGELFVSGRMKDLIIKGGRNYHPYAFEEAAGRVPGARPGGIAAFGVQDAASGTEQIYLVVETALEEREAVRALCAQVDRAVLAATGLRPDRVLPAPPRTIPKTGSGKAQRALLRERVLQEQGDFAGVMAPSNASLQAEAART